MQLRCMISRSLVADDEFGDNSYAYSEIVSFSKQIGEGQIHVVALIVVPTDVRLLARIFVLELRGETVG